MNHVYMHSFRSIIEATENLTDSNLVILFGVGEEEIFQKLSKNSNARRGGLPGG